MKLFHILTCYITLHAIPIYCCKDFPLIKTPKSIPNRVQTTDPDTRPTTPKDGNILAVSTTTYVEVPNYEYRIFSLDTDTKQIIQIKNSFDATVCALLLIYKNSKKLIISNSNAHHEATQATLLSQVLNKMHQDNNNLPIRTNTWLAAPGCGKRMPDNTFKMVPNNYVETPIRDLTFVVNQIPTSNPEQNTIQKIYYDCCRKGNTPERGRFEINATDPNNVTFTSFSEDFEPYPFELQNPLKPR